jgi:preprotein translocase subunit YajC
MPLASLEFAAVALATLLQENAAPPTGAPTGAAPAGGAAAKSGGLFGGDMLVPLLLFVVIFYLLMWRPQAKERKARTAMLAALKKGDRVVLTCGLVGEIAALTEQDVYIRFDDKDQRRLRFKRYAIHSALVGDELPVKVEEGAAAKS